MRLVEIIYKVAKKLPKEEVYGLSSQIKRAAVSIPSNIAEGRRRGHRKEYLHFLLNAYGSGAELETQIEIIKRIYSVDEKLINEMGSLLEEVMKMLNAIINKMTEPTS